MKKANRARIDPVQAAPRRRLRKRGDMMVEEIKGWMMQRQAKVGDKLPKEAELQALFGLSKGSTREALKSLEVQGLVTLKSGHGRRRHGDAGAVPAHIPVRAEPSFLSRRRYCDDLRRAPPARARARGERDGARGRRDIATPRGEHRVVRTASHQPRTILAPAGRGCVFPRRHRGSRAERAAAVQLQVHQRDAALDDRVQGGWRCASMARSCITPTCRRTRRSSQR